MRRGSLIGPIILIGIGGLFLLNNLKPELPVLELIGNYWPYALIAWGVLRLAEIVFWWASGKALPVHGISGGEWVLIVFLCIVGSALHFGTRISHRWPGARIGVGGLEIFGETYDYPYQEQKRTVGKTPRILVENLRGITRITGIDSEELKVTGRATVRAFDQGDADRILKGCPLEVVQQGDLLVIRTNQDRAPNAHRMASDLEIAVPKGTVVQGRGRSGDFDVSEVAAVDISGDTASVRVTNIAGNVRADLRRSDILRATGVKGNIDLKSNSGSDIELENIEGQATVNGSFSGELMFRNLLKPLRFESHQTELRVEKVPGQLRVSRGELIAHGIDGPVVLRAESKDVELADFTQTLELAINRGDVELRPGKLPLAKMEVRTRSGDVHLALPPGARFELRASTARGEIDNEFGSPLTTERNGRGGVLAGSVGGGAQIQVATDRGAVIVRKVSPADVPESPQPPSPPKPPKVERELKVEQQ